MTQFVPRPPLFRALSTEQGLLGLPGSLVRFGLVGLVNNAALLGVYAAAAALGTPRPLAVSLVFLVGMAQGFLLNKSFAFRFKGGGGRELARYLLVYGLALLADVVLLEVLVVFAGVPHILAQALLIVVIALALYVAMDRFVFPTSGRTSSARAP